MVDRLSLRARMALAWGLGFFILGSVLVVILAFYFQGSLAEYPSVAISLIVTNLGLEVGQVDELTVTDPAGNSVDAAQIGSILRAVVAGTRSDLVTALWLVLPALAIVAALAGWWLAGRTMRPIVSMTEQVRRVSSQRLDARIGRDGPHDELHDLADAFDGMMDRLEHAFVAQRLFAAAASHELRTPLTLIRAELDVALDTPDASREELDAMAEGIRYAVGRSEQVIDGLLLLARTGIVERTTSSDLAELIDRALDEAAGLLAERGITVRQAVERGTDVQCDPVLLERMVRNLIDNGAIHNEPNGWIEIETSRAGDEVVLRITNSGTPLDETQIARLGEPFYRATTGQRVAPGTGLGLAIATSIAEAHDGRLDIAGRPGGGVIATVVLPAIERDRSMPTKQSPR
jgi:signal transduction histidine kinase